MSGRGARRPRQRRARRAPSRRRKPTGGSAGLLRKGLVWLSVAGLAGLAVAGMRVFGRDAGSVTETRTLPVPDTRVRVEVLNGGGVSGAARQATELARDAGFDVVFFGNASSFDRSESEVVDRVGRLEFARLVADALGIANVRSEPDPNLYVDVSVVLGSAWQPDSAGAAGAGGP